MILTPELQTLSEKLQAFTLWYSKRHYSDETGWDIGPEGQHNYGASSYVNQTFFLFVHLFDDMRMVGVGAEEAGSLHALGMGSTGHAWVQATYQGRRIYADLWGADYLQLPVFSHPSVNMPYPVPRDLGLYSNHETVVREIAKDWERFSREYDLHLRGIERLVRGLPLLPERDP